MSCGLSPSGPISAVFLSVLSGSTLPSFLSSTVERAAALRAALRSSGVTKLFGSAAFV